MSKDPKINMPENIMSLIKKGHIKMKPQSYFILSSLVMIGGVVGLSVFLVFLVSLMSFSLRTHGPMGSMRYQQLLSSFPWWALIVAIIGIGFGIRLLKKYDFSYKKNFLVIILSFILIILISGWLINYLGLDTLWMRQGRMKEFYQRYDGGVMIREPSWRMMEDDNRGIFLNKQLNIFKSR